MHPSSPPIDVPWGQRNVVTGIVAAAFVSIVSLLVALVLSDTAVPTWAALLATLMFQVALLAIAVRLGPGATERALLLFGPRRLHTLPLFAWGALALLGSLALTAVYVTVVTQFFEDLAPTPLPFELDSTVVRWFAFVVVVLIGPAAEEVFFRGFVFAGLLKALGPMVAVLVSAFVFAAAHLEIALLGPAFLSGIVFATVYLRTGSLWTVVLAHTAQNAIAFGLSG